MWQITNKACNTFSQKNILPPVSMWVGENSSVVHVLTVTIINVLTTSLGGNPQLLCCLSVLLCHTFLRSFNSTAIGSSANTVGATVLQCFLKNYPGFCCRKEKLFPKSKKTLLGMDLGKYLDFPLK